jgi:hypothetical protein
MIGARYDPTAITRVRWDDGDAATDNRGNSAEGQSVWQFAPNDRARVLFSAVMSPLRWPTCQGLAKPIGFETTRSHSERIKSHGLGCGASVQCPTVATSAGAEARFGDERPPPRFRGGIVDGYWLAVTATGRSAVASSQTVL